MSKKLQIKTSHFHADDAGGVLGVAVYNWLRREIVSGSLRPNQALVEAEIAERLDISRVPVREGLHRLAAEGMVRSQRRRWVVHEHTPAEVRDIYQVRAALESEAAGLAAIAANDADIAAIKKAGVPKAFFGAPTREARIEQNEQFHGLIIKASRNLRIEEMLRYNTTYFNFRFSLIASQKQLEESGRQHLLISQAIAERNQKKARDTAHSHVMHALSIVEKLF